MIRVIILSLALVAGNAFAGIGDPWYLAYRVQGGTIVQYKGPYSDRFQCQADRFNLPFGVEYLGCYQ